MSSFCKCKCKATHIFFSKNISIYAIINGQSFNDMLTNDNVSFEQLGPDLYRKYNTRTGLQSSRKRRIRRIFTPIFAFVRVKFPSEDSHLRSIVAGRPNWTSKTYQGLPKFLLSIEIDTRDVQKLSKSPPTFNELYDVCPAYLLEIRYLCWLSFKDVPLPACGSFIDIGVKRRGILLMAAWSLCVFVTRAELINWCLYN